MGNSAGIISIIDNGDRIGSTIAITDNENNAIIIIDNIASIIPIIDNGNLSSNKSVSIISIIDNGENNAIFYY